MNTEFYQSIPIVQQVQRQLLVIDYAPAKSCRNFQKIDAEIRSFLALK